jgi:hypothetical protein
VTLVGDKFAAPTHTGGDCSHQSRGGGRGSDARSLDRQETFRVESWSEVIKVRLGRDGREMRFTQRSHAVSIA